MKIVYFLKNQQGLTVLGHFIFTLMLSTVTLTALVLNSGESEKIYEFLVVKIKFLINSAWFFISKVVG
jgi:hypothetical protein